MTEETGYEEQPVEETPQPNTEPKTNLVWIIIAWAAAFTGLLLVPPIIWFFSKDEKVKKHALYASIAGAIFLVIIVLIIIITAVALG